MSSYERAGKRADEIQAFHNHLGVYFIVNILLPVGWKECYLFLLGKGQLVKP